MCHAIVETNKYNAALWMLRNMVSLIWLSYKAFRISVLCYLKPVITIFLFLFIAYYLYLYLYLCLYSI